MLKTFAMQRKAIEDLPPWPLAASSQSADAKAIINQLADEMLAALDRAQTALDEIEQRGGDAEAEFSLTFKVNDVIIALRSHGRT